MTIQSAIVSQDTFALDSRNIYLPGLITYEDGPNDGFVLTITPIGPADLDLGIVEVIIGSADLQALRAMIDQKQPADPSAPCYDCRTNQTRLDTLDSEYVTLTQAVDGLRNWLRRHDQRMEEIQATSNRLVLFAGSDQEQKDLAERMACLETVIANLGIETRLSELERRMGERVDTSVRHSQRIENLEKLNLSSRIAYLENRAQGITGPDAGL